MQHATSALWRIDFRTDLTRADAPVIPLGFMLEAGWNNRARWLGMAFRRSLTALELDLVNVATWSELEEPEPFMKMLFLDTWKIPVSDDQRLGSAATALKFHTYSSLQFVLDDAPVSAGKFDTESSFKDLYSQLLGLKLRLNPVLTAPVLNIKPRLRPATNRNLEVGLLNEAA